MPQSQILAPEIGHQDIREKIVKSYLQGQLPHAYLFYGPEGSGKDAFAISIARWLNCVEPDGSVDAGSPQYLKISHLQHPDVQFVFPTPAQSNLKSEELGEALAEKAANPYRAVGFSGKNIFIGIDTIRELKKEARFKLYEGRRKLFIISEADQMRVEAANALLKLLEEPPDNLMLILTTANIHKILPTIKSRCQLISFNRLTAGEIEMIVRHYAGGRDLSQLPEIIRLAQFNLRRIFDFLDRDVLAIRDAAIEFLRKVVRMHRSQELLELIEPFAGQRDRQDAALLLSFLLLWFQDILHLRTLPAEEWQPANADQMETLSKFVEFSRNADLSRIVGGIESALQDVNDARNLNPLLILTTLAIKLQSMLK